MVQLHTGTVYIFYRIFLHVIICKFSLRTSKNYTQNVTEPLTHAQTVRSSLIFSSAWEQGEGGFHQNSPAAMSINDTNLIVNCTFLPYWL